MQWRYAVKKTTLKSLEGKMSPRHYREKSRRLGLRQFARRTSLTVEEWDGRERGGEGRTLGKERFHFGYTAHLWNQRGRAGGREDRGH